MLCGVRRYIRLKWSFRSLYVPCYSVTTLPVNVPGWLAATTLATRAPGKKIAATRYPQLIPFGFRVGRDEASLQVTPSRRIPAPRPGLQETLRRFSAGPWSRYRPFISKVQCHRWVTGDPSPKGRGRKPPGIRSYNLLPAARCGRGLSSSCWRRSRLASLCW